MIANLLVLSATDESQGLLHHLLVDQLIKFGIVVAALIFLAAGMVVIWKKAGPPSNGPRDE